MLPSAPTVSCHPLRSAPALSASSAGAAAAGLPRGRGTFASGGGMAVARHLATVAGPLRSVRCPGCRLVRSPLREPVAWVALPLPAASPVPVATATAGAIAAGQASGPGGPSGGCPCPFALLPPAFGRWRRCIQASIAAGSGIIRLALASAGLPRLLPVAARPLPVVWRSVLAAAGAFARWCPVVPGWPSSPASHPAQNPAVKRNSLQKLAVTASFPLAFLPPSIPGYKWMLSPFAESSK